MSKFCIKLLLDNLGVYYKKQRDIECDKKLLPWKEKYLNEIESLYQDIENGNKTAKMISTIISTQDNQLEDKDFEVKQILVEAGCGWNYDTNSLTLIDI